MIDPVWSKIVTPVRHLLHQTFSKINLLPSSVTLAQSLTAGSSAKFGMGWFGMAVCVAVIYAFAVCTQSSQGSTSQPQSAISLPEFFGVWAGGGDNFGFVTFGVAPRTSTAAAISGIQRANGVRSATSTMYQHFLAASQRPPSAFTASFSANGVTKLILIR